MPIKAGTAVKRRSANARGPLATGNERLRACFSFIEKRAKSKRACDDFRSGPDQRYNRQDSFRSLHMEIAIQVPWLAPLRVSMDQVLFFIR
jgi:hypothetical protein